MNEAGRICRRENNRLRNLIRWRRTARQEVGDQSEANK